MCEYRWIKFSCHTTHASRLGEIWSSACDAPVAGPKPPGRVAALCRDKMFRHPTLTLETQKCYACFIEEFPHMKEWQWRVNIIVALDIADGHVGGNAWVRWMPCNEEYWEGFLYNDERGMASAA